MRWTSLILLFISLPGLAAFEIGGSTGSPFDCDQVSRKIVRDWVSMKDLMAPERGEKKRPRSDDFQCIDPRYTRGQVEVRSVGGGGLKCFTSGQPGGRGICCNTTMTSCSMYAPR